MNFALFLQQVVNGLLDGVYYLLIALGLSLIFSLGGIVNLAHGAFYAIGAYISVLLLPHVGFGGSLDRHADRRRPDRHTDRTLAVPALLPRRPDPVAVADLRPRHGRRAGSARDLRRTADLRRDPAGAKGPDLHRRLRLFVLPHHPAGDRRRLHHGAVVPAAEDRLRPRRARRRAEPGHGRRARHLAAALHDGGGRPRHRPRRPCRRAAGADLLGPSGDGPGDHHAGLRRVRDRRPRLVLGRGTGGAAGRTCQRRDHRHRLSAGVDRGDLFPDAARAAVQARAACSASASSGSSEEREPWTPARPPLRPSPPPRCATACHCSSPAPGCSPCR